MSGGRFELRAERRAAYFWDIILQRKRWSQYLDGSIVLKCLFFLSSMFYFTRCFIRFFRTNGTECIRTNLDITNKCIPTMNARESGRKALFKYFFKNHRLAFLLLNGPSFIGSLFGRRYGNELAYPACETSRLLAKLSGHKTLTLEALGLIRSLGYEIEWAQPASKFSKLTKGNEL